MYELHVLIFNIFGVETLKEMCVVKLNAKIKHTCILSTV